MIVGHLVAHRLREAIGVFLRDRDQPLDNYVVLSGAALWLHGLRQHFGDVDLYVPGLVSEVTDIHGFEIESHSTMDTIAPGLGDDVFRDRVFSHGIYVQSPESILRMKLLLGRPKDIPDIEILRTYLKG